MDKGDERKWTTDEVSRSGYIQSKATKYVAEWKAVLKNTKYGGNLFTFRMAGVIQVAWTLFGLNYGTREPAYWWKFVINATVKGFADKQKGNAQ